jgi:hypothetical protein
MSALDFDAVARSALQETANVLAGAEPPDDVLARYRAARADLDHALCIETSIMIGRTPVPCGAHIVLLPLGGTMDAVLAAVGSPRGGVSPAR